MREHSQKLKCLWSQEPVKTQRSESEKKWKIQRFAVRDNWQKHKGPWSQKWPKTKRSARGHKIGQKFKGPQPEKMKKTERVEGLRKKSKNSKACIEEKGNMAKSTKIYLWSGRQHKTEGSVVTKMAKKLIGLGSEKKAKNPKVHSQRKMLKIQTSRVRQNSQQFKGV